MIFTLSHYSLDVGNIEYFFQFLPSVPSLSPWRRVQSSGEAVNKALLEVWWRKKAAKPCSNACVHFCCQTEQSQCCVLLRASFRERHQQSVKDSLPMSKVKFFFFSYFFFSDSTLREEIWLFKELFCKGRMSWNAMQGTPLRRDIGLISSCQLRLSGVDVLRDQQEFFSTKDWWKLPIQMF